MKNRNEDKVKEDKMATKKRCERRGRAAPKKRGGKCGKKLKKKSAKRKVGRLKWR